jgi:hypothetical protein
LREYSFGWRQPLAAVLGVAAFASTIGLAAIWVVRGADDPLDDGPTTVLPVFAAAELARPSAPRVLVLRDDGPTVGYGLVDDPAGSRLGDADVLRRGDPRAAEVHLAHAVQEAVAGQSDAVPVLVEFGISMVLVPKDDAASGAQLAEADGLSRVPTGDAVVWRTDAHAGRLAVLDPDTAAEVTAGADLPADTAARLLSFDDDATSTRIKAGPSGRLLVLAEPADSHWRASVGGEQLTATRAYGWAQAWSLPSTGGQLEISRSGDHRGWWLLGQLVAVVAVALLALPSRRSSREDDDTDEPLEVPA